MFTRLLLHIIIIVTIIIIIIIIFIPIYKGSWVMYGILQGQICPYRKYSNTVIKVSKPNKQFKLILKSKVAHVNFTPFLDCWLFTGSGKEEHQNRSNWWNQGVGWGEKSASHDGKRLLPSIKSLGECLYPIGPAELHNIQQGPDIVTLENLIAAISLECSGFFFHNWLKKLAAVWDLCFQEE